MLPRNAPSRPRTRRGPLPKRALVVAITLAAVVALQGVLTPAQADEAGLRLDLAGFSRLNDLTQAAPGEFATWAAQSAGTVEKPTAITLITGDRVQLVTRGGRQDVAIEPGRGGARSPMRIRRSGGHVFVVPMRAQALLDAGKLDPRLFDITQLAADGFTDQRAGALPLIVTAATGPLSSTAPGVRKLSGAQLPAQALRQARSMAQPPPAPAGSTVQRRIPRLGATAVKVPAERAIRFWRSLTGPGNQARSSATTLESAGGVGAVWLDGRIHASLDKSVPQIGGPAARAKSLDGKGVRVAVLDTGIDDQHPDLAGRVAAEQDFVGEGDVDDHNGHGTHVASTVAGSGARSGGKYAGVAPGASLLDGKVLDGAGEGSDSSVLAGMEWAAGRSPVVSMSLSRDDPRDGIDPLALAVDALSAQHNTLFVISAGNSGDGGEDSTVGSPGSATSALTVGAVDGKDVLADFSSRGPRQGGSLIKPEITAPGVEIVAAQADGTQAGDVAAPGYVALSGTSMATPHVAGAAALLRQHHPAWTAAQVKAALVASAKPSPTTSVWAQGAGRVDLANATANPLRVDAGTLDFGLLTFPHTDDQPVTRQLTYTNDSKAPLDVTITGALANDGGKHAPAPAVTANDPKFTLAAGASKTLTVSVTPDTLDIGRWSGLVSASTSAGVTRTAIGVIKERELYTVTPAVTDRHGRKVETGEAGHTSVDLINMVTGAFTKIADERAARVPPGTYAVSAWIHDPELLQDTLVNRLNVRVTKNTRVTLDARGSVPYRSIVPRADAVVTLQSLGYEIRPSQSSEPVPMSLTLGDEHEDASPRDDLWVHPVATGPSIGRFDLSVFSDHRPRELAARLIGGSPLKLSPVTVARRDAYTELEGRHTVEVVKDTGPVAGRFVLATVPADSTADHVAAGLAKAGAAGVILRFGVDDNPFFDEDPPIPALGLPEAQWSALGQRAAEAASGSARIEITGTQFPANTYNVLETFSGRVPRSLSFTYRDRDLARIDRTFRSHGTGGTGVTFLEPIAPGTGEYSMSARMKLGTHRTDWVSPGVAWFTGTKSSYDPEIGKYRTILESAPRTYPRGRRTVETFGAQLARPAAPRTNAYGMFPARKANTLNGYLSSWTDPDGRVSHHGPGDSVAWKLSTGGQVVAKGSDPGVSVKLRPARTHYTLQLDAQRKAGDGWALSTASSTRWTFDSASVTGRKPVPAALLSLDIKLPLDIANSAPRGTPMNLTVTGRLPEGLPEVRLAALTVETSTDAGKTWTRAAIKRRTADTFAVQVNHPNRTGPVSLRMHATARGQVSLQQEVTAAYALR